MGLNPVNTVMKVTQDSTKEGFLIEQKEYQEETNDLGESMEVSYSRL